MIAVRNFMIALTRNPISLSGSAITTSTAVLFAILFVLQLIGSPGSPYAGILTYLVLPALFLVGLLLIPVGIVRERRRARIAEAGGEPPPAFPVVDLNRDRTRRIFLTFLVLTLLNAVILAVATYKGVEVMESTEFCGETCHRVMEPEYTTYRLSPHSRVRCVECHIGPGADWFVKSKLSGAWQVVSVVFGLYPRPIPVPVHSLRPARETCEQCHWPTKFIGDRLKVLTRYAEDEANTELKTALLLRVGGLQGRVSQGIHWHVDPGIRIRYRSDPSRERIDEVEMTLADGEVRSYRRGGKAGAGGEGDGAENEWRVMDCIDCHNRPSHIYRLPGKEIDSAIEVGRISPSIPYIRREGLRVLKEEYPSHEAARRGIVTALTSHYAENHPEFAEARAESIEQAGRALGEIYCRNVFPDMKVSWGSYPNHIGHVDFDGCFRCHSDEHTTADGQVISQDCDVCHTLLAMEEEDPEILKMLQP